MSTKMIVKLCIAGVAVLGIGLYQLEEAYCAVRQGRPHQMCASKQGGKLRTLLYI